MKRLWDMLNVKIIQTRWALGQKALGLVRARLVCKDFKFLGQSSLKEGHYLPTSSIESLRSILCISETVLTLQLGDQLMMMTMDVSTAFLPCQSFSRSFTQYEDPIDGPGQYGSRLKNHL